MTDNATEYRQHGATLLKGLYPREVVEALAYQLSCQVRASGTRMLQPPQIGNKPSYEGYCYKYPILLTFLWGLTPQIQQLTGARLLPSYSYFRTYQQGDVCRVHSDRPACENSLSLTLAYADDIEWALGVGRRPLPEDQRQTSRGKEDFGDEEHTEFPMAPGDAVLYRGVEYAHGRITPNPNRWSVHLFMHWVDRDGPYADHAFDGQQVTGQTEFRFP